MGGMSVGGKDEPRSKSQAALERYREENPGEFAGWFVPKTGGYVVAIGNVKAYRGPCKRCETGVVTAVRKLSLKQQSEWNISGQGRWPEVCSDCQAKQQRHGTSARAAQRRYRERMKLRAEQLARDRAEREMDRAHGKGWREAWMTEDSSDTP